jgi:hypothetical protein
MPAAHYATGLQLDHPVASQLHNVRHFAICLYDKSLPSFKETDKKDETLQIDHYRQVILTVIKCVCDTPLGNMSVDVPKTALALSWYRPSIRYNVTSECISDIQSFLLLSVAGWWWTCPRGELQHLRWTAMLETPYKIWAAPANRRENPRRPFGNVHERQTALVETGLNSREFLAGRCQNHCFFPPR